MDWKSQRLCRWRLGDGLILKLLFMVLEGIELVVTALLFQQLLVGTLFQDPAFRQKDDIGETEIGYCIGRTWWHKGIVSEALTAVIHYLFAEVGMNRISARHDPNNPHSGGVMRKCGMTYEGTTRSSDRNNQGICDAALYAILRSEWQG